jgi:hypothetical protein
MITAEANHEGVPTKNHVVYTKSDEALATILKNKVSPHPPAHYYGPCRQLINLA